MKKKGLVISFCILFIILLGYFFYYEREWFGLENKENFSQNPEVFAKLPLSDDLFLKENSSPDFLPIRNWDVPQIQIESRATLSLLKSEPEKILYQNNIQEELPIASLTKLITAVVVLENYNLNDFIKISKKAVMTEGEAGRLVVGEEISVKNLLYALLMQSSNDAAVALAEVIGEENFLNLMNEKVRELGLNHTYLSDPAGLSDKNLSTALELAKITATSISEPLIPKILQTAVIDVQSRDGWINHHLVNSNELLEKIPRVIGGKTGYTEEAKDCMVLVLETENKEKIINVILGAEDRFKEMEKLVNWINSAYLWR